MRVIRFLGAFIALCVLLSLLAAGGIIAALWFYGRDLPDYQQLADYQPPVTTRVQAGDGRLITEFAHERRLFVPVDVMPKRVINAFLSAEDKNFFTHPGVDFSGVGRAVVQNLAKIGQNRRPVGASTITQQVAKNFLLTNEVSLGRKVKEAILAFRIEQAFSKEHILELYLNEIYLGSGAYGVAAASLYYFDKPLDQLTIAEAAYLAALPKAPNNYNSLRFPDRAKARRDWVIERMAEDGVITAAEMQTAEASPLQIKARDSDVTVRADWFAEEIRRQLAQRYGEKDLYEGGLSVRTSMDPKLQSLGERVVRAGLVSYDRRHGWRGPVARVDAGEGWRERLAGVDSPPGLIDPWKLALVLKLDDAQAEIGFADGRRASIAMEDMRWARPRKEEQTVGPSPKQPRDVLAPGDVVAVEPVNAAKTGYALRQIPDVGGALVAMDPHTGRVLALVGGWDFHASQFNRAVQALRQPGSSFKPFVYSAALDRGYTPSSLVLDAPFVIDQGPGLPKWKPGNYTHEFFGPSTLRVGVEKSRNLMTVRLAQAIGMEAVVQNAKKFGVVDDLQPVLSMALGAGETTLMKMTAGYSEFVNGGKRITPTLIDRIQDRNGKTIFKHDDRPCDGCNVAVWDHQSEPVIPDTRPQIMDPGTAYQMVSIMQGVVERGTGIRIRELGKTLAGKTGTSNDSKDTWFIGFTPDLAVGVFVGFDNPRTMGVHEQGATAALPIFKDFMAEALQGKPSIPFRVPPGIRLVRVNAETGLPAKPGERNIILEAFKPGTEPGSDRTVLDGSEGIGGISGAGASAGETPSSGTGGLY